MLVRAENKKIKKKGVKSESTVPVPCVSHLPLGIMALAVEGVLVDAIRQIHQQLLSTQQTHWLDFLIRRVQIIIQRSHWLLSQEHSISADAFQVVSG
jgi:hypothetical protein